MIVRLQKSVGLGAKRRCVALACAAAIAALSACSESDESTAEKAGEVSAPPPANADPASLATDANGTPTAACVDAVTNDAVNWDETTLFDEHEIVKCLWATLGRPIGYGENTTGGYDPNGASSLVVITTGGSQSPEEQLEDAVQDGSHNWIVFDKDDFRNEVEIGMYRLWCDDSEVLGALGGASTAQCIDYRAWCASRNIDADDCGDEFYNKRFNDRDLPIRNVQMQSNTTIDGRGASPTFRFSGFRLGRTQNGSSIEQIENVIFTHLTFRGDGHVEDHELNPDMLGTNGESFNIWIHKNDFIRTNDSAFDIQHGSRGVTISFNRMVDSLRVSLHGGPFDNEVNARIRSTWHHNMYVTTDSFYSFTRGLSRRIPFLERGSTHHFNNVAVDYRRNVGDVRRGGTLLYENVLFLGTERLQSEDPTVEEAFDEWVKENLVTGVEQDGRFGTDGSLAAFVSNDCQINPDFIGPLVGGSGAPNPIGDYSQRTRDAMATYLLEPDQTLVNYVNATSGVNGVAPFMSPFGDTVEIVASGPQPDCRR